MLDKLGQPGRNDTAIETACRDLVNGYSRCVDNFEDEALVQMFAREGRWLQPRVAPFEGREQIRAFLASRDRAVTMRHAVTNVLVDVRDATHASGVCYFTVYRQPRDTPAAQALTPFAVGEYHDEFVLEEGRWRFASRDIRFAFRGA